jgi:Zn-finger nucleic acid-binding protein
MLCTVCKQGKLTYTYLEDSLPCHQCVACRGHWIKLDAYLNWLGRRDANEDRLEKSGFEVNSADSRQVLICPETGSLMLKFKVSNHMDCHIDYSSACAGVWLDTGEWEVLKQAGLVFQLNQIATDVWQSRLRKERAKKVFEEKYEGLFGAEDHQKLKELKTWLADKDKAREMLAYLSSKNPYGIY